MDAQVLADAQKYQRLRQYSLDYYHLHAETISARRKDRYRATHPDAIPRPNAKPRGVKPTDLNNIPVEQ